MEGIFVYDLGIICEGFLFRFDIVWIVFINICYCNELLEIVFLWLFCLLIFGICLSWVLF